MHKVKKNIESENLFKWNFYEKKIRLEWNQLNWNKKSNLFLDLKYVIIHIFSDINYS